MRRATLIQPQRRMTGLVLTQNRAMIAMGIAWPMQTVMAYAMRLRRRVAQIQRLVILTQRLRKTMAHARYWTLAVTAEETVLRAVELREHATTTRR